MSAAAACAGPRIRRLTAQRAAEQARRNAEREKLRRQRLDRSRRAKSAFKKFSSDGKSIQEKDVPEFLAAVCNVRDTSMIETHAVKLVIDTAKQNQKGPISKDENDNIMLAEDAILSSVEKYVEYLSKAKYIDEIYHKFDKDHNGYLSRGELRKALDKYEVKKTPRVDENSVVLRVVVLDEDLDFILQHCDYDNTGQINKSELLPAIAAWEELVQIKVDEASKMCCIIL